MTVWQNMKRRWARVVQALTEDEFLAQWARFKSFYDHLEPLILYIESQLLQSCPESFLQYYTRRYLHLGETATSRTEGAHWMLKQDLHVSNHDLLVVFTRFEQVVERQFTKIQVNRSLARRQRPITPSFLFQLVSCQVSKKAINLVIKLMNYYLPISEDDDDTKKKAPIPLICDCDALNTTGVPCIHTIQESLELSRPFTIELFHRQWWLYGDTKDIPPIDPILLINNPNTVRARGRPAGATNFSQATSSQASTQQDPSGWELMSYGPQGGLGGRGGRAWAQGAAPGRPQGSGVDRQRGQGPPRGQRGSRRGQGRQRGHGWGEVDSDLEDDNLLF
ncbi:hypothetical protein N7540_002393 [Penicillium herquei]|nr:hypothetical protein N7540_002393 [Penicillium herquei]